MSFRIGNVPFKTKNSVPANVNPDPNKPKFYVTPEERASNASKVKEVTIILNELLKKKNKGDLVNADKLKLEECQKILKKSMTIVGPDATTYLLSGRISLIKGDLKSALKYYKNALLDFERMLAFAKTSSKTLPFIPRFKKLGALICSDLSYTYLRLKKYSTAKQYGLQGLAMQPSLVNNHVHLAKVFAAEGKNADAIQILKKYQKRFGTHPEIAALLDEIQGSK